MGAGHRIVLVFDEVKTGFRIANGGAQEFFGIQADLVTFAKSMGNGFPIAAIAGKEEFMMTIEPGKVAHGGTYSGNIAGVAAADATLEILENEPVLENVFASGQKLMSGIDEILTEADMPHVLTGLPSIFGIILGTDQAPQDFREYFNGNQELYEEMGMELVNRGVMPDADGREPWFLCQAHESSVIDETLNIFNDTIRTVKKRH